MADRYGYLFDFLVNQLNVYTAPTVALDKKGEEHYIAFLDIFGFETMKTNSLEQLCINYANEQLQHQFNRATFTAEINVYTEEKLKQEILDGLSRYGNVSRILVRCERAGTL